MKVFKLSLLMSLLRICLANLLKMSNFHPVKKVRYVQFLMYFFHYILMMQQLFSLTVADLFMHAKQAHTWHLNRKALKNTCLGMKSACIFCVLNSNH